ncbi:MAG: WD40 repeat domain-containing protein, partial [Cyanophyceae cyanobacterium]
TTIISASGDSTVKLWDVNTGELLRTHSGHSHWEESASISPDGNNIVSASGDGTVKLWKVEAFD